MQAAMKALLAAAVVGALLLIVPAAQAERLTKLDRDHGVRFTLDGAVLTVRLEPQPGQSPADIPEDVWGRQIRAACSPVFTFRPRKARRLAVVQTQLWPEGQLELRYRFGRDISDRVKWCILEEASGRDVAEAGFAPFIRVHASTPRERRIGRLLRRHLLERGAQQPWFPEALAIVVDDGMTAISTDLRRTVRGRRIARRLCSLVTSSGVATGRAAVYGDVVKLRSCGAPPGRASGPRLPEP
jgi:hypothetical protein